MFPVQYILVAYFIPNSLYLLIPYPYSAPSPFPLPTVTIDFFFFLLAVPRHAACGILVPGPVIKPLPRLQWKHSLNYQTTWKVPVTIDFFFFFNLFIYGCVWVFVSVRGLSLVVASGGHSSSRCAGLSLSWPLLLRSTGSRRAGSVIVAHGPSCSAACGIFPDQGSNPCPLH